MTIERGTKPILQRIDITYVRETPPWRQLRFRLGMLLLVVTCALMVALMAVGDYSAFEAGPVTEPHAMFENDCQACHDRSFMPFARLLTMQLDSSTSPSTSDARCRHCHDVGDHFAGQRSTDVRLNPHCATCHQEHEGMAALIDVSDNHCTGCHANLSAIHPETTLANSVVDFETHPPFAIHRDGDQATDPGALFFSHSAHMPKDPEKLALFLGASGLQEGLTCRSCHVPEESGKGFLPISYERDCAACHRNALEFDRARFPGETVPHGSPDLVVGFLQAKYADSIEDEWSATDDGPRFDRSASRRRVDDVVADALGRLSGSDSSPAPSTPTTSLDQAKRMLAGRGGGCRYCHVVVETSEELAELPARWRRNSFDFTPPLDEDVEMVGGKSEEPSDGASTEQSPTKPWPIWRVVDVNIPDTWLPKSDFDHDSHRFLRCQDCHQSVGESHSAADVLMPAIDNCRTCHGESGFARRVRDSCVSCHGYHVHAESKSMRSDGRMLIEAIMDGRYDSDNVEPTRVPTSTSDQP
ncbi:Doubled CXXCH motif [Planctomycetes bacterium Pan216]|uniref:Doubled CXXCH motif n=1 Tax=Kolteria novifilia TaxID=2527975 RepID=A0A518B7X1_9BACT|nr:Doubled CXXCH motif [Planctomycetes bacterium Pan216]